MKKMMLMSLLLPLAGCAGTTEKAAEAELEPVRAVVAANQAPAEAIVEPVPVAEVPVQSEVAQTVAIAAVEPSGWDLLSRRVIAWGDPVRRSMEQYCLPENTTRNP